MEIVQSELAVQRFPVKKVKFWREQFRGRWEDKSRIYVVEETKPAIYKMQDQLIVHPELYQQLRAHLAPFEAGKASFGFPKEMEPKQAPRRWFSWDHDWGPIFKPDMRHFVDTAA